MRNRLIYFCAIILVYGLFVVLQPVSIPKTDFPPLESVVTSTQELVYSATTTNALISRVVDGDTVVALFDGQKEEAKIRLLGINTPESVDPRRPVQCFGKEASAFAKAWLKNKRVRLDQDFEADNIDKYGRFLRNIVLEDGTDMNGLMIKKGYANAYLSFPMNAKRKAELKEFEKQARAEKLGLWSDETCAGKK